MKPLHIGSFVCFAIAMAFYLLAWVPGLIGFSIFGVFFEVAAWIKLLSREDSGRE